MENIDKQIIFDSVRLRRSTIDTLLFICLFEMVIVMMIAARSAQYEFGFVHILIHTMPRSNTREANLYKHMGDIRFVFEHYKEMEYVAA